MKKEGEKEILLLVAEVHVPFALFKKKTHLILYTLKSCSPSFHYF